MGKVTKLAVSVCIMESLFTNVEERRAAQSAFSQASAHPVEAIQKDWLRNQLENKHFVMGNVYGSHLPMRIKMEMSILSQVQRPPGLPSHHVGLDTILGRDETIDFEDYLGGAPAFRPCLASVRATANAALNMFVNSSRDEGAGRRRTRLAGAEARSAAAHIVAWAARQFAPRCRCDDASQQRGYGQGPLLASRTLHSTCECGVPSGVPSGVDVTAECNDFLHWSHQKRHWTSSCKGSCAMSGKCMQEIYTGDCMGRTVITICQNFRLMQSAVLISCTFVTMIVPSETHASALFF